MSRHILSHAVAAVATLAAAGAILSQTIDYSFVGSDSLTTIVWSRVGSPADVWRLWSEPTANTYYPYKVYRPLLALSAGIDLGFYGLASPGFQVTSAVFWAVSALALYALAVRSFGPGAWLGALTTLAVYLSFPASIQVAAVVARRSEALCVTFLCLALVTQLRRVDRPMPRGAIGPACFTFMALAAKETGIVAAPLALVAVFLATKRRGFERLRQSLWAAVPHVLAAALLLGLRTFALEGLGGYPMTRVTGAVWRLLDAIGQLSFRVPLSEPEMRTTLLPWALAGALVGCSVWLLVAWGRRSMLGNDRGELSPASRALVLAVVWGAATATIYGAAGLIQPWYLLIPAAAWSLALGAVADVVQRTLSSEDARARLPGGATAALLGAWLLFQAWYSPVFRVYPQWTRASRIVETTLGELDAGVRAAKPGDVVRVGRPREILRPRPGDPVTGFAVGISARSLEAWADAAHPDLPIRIHWPRKRPPPDPDHIVVVFDDGAG